MVRFTAIILFLLLNTDHALALTPRDWISRQKKYIRELYLQEKFFNSIAETRRLLYYTNNHNKKEYHYFIEVNYYKGNQFKTVIDNLKDHGDINEMRYLLILSHSYYRLNYHIQALSALSPRGGNYSEEEMNEITLRKVEIYLSDFNFNGALSELKNREKSISFYDRTLISDMEEYRELHYKSKALSTALSAVLPGSGQAYSGRYLDGLISFLSLGALLAGAYFAEKNGERGLAVTAAFFSVLVYSGNLYGAYQSAFKYNLDTNRRFAERFIENHITPYNPEKYCDMDRLFQ